jgi:hypothetical protein
VDVVSGVAPAALILALRPAQIAVNWLGQCGPTGASPAPPPCVLCAGDVPGDMLSMQGTCQLSVQGTCQLSVQGTCQLSVQGTCRLRP